MATTEPEDRISLARIVAALRDQLEDAGEKQQLRIRDGLKQGRRQLVPPLILRTIELETKIVTEISQKADGHINVWVVNAGIDSQRADTTTHTVRLKLDLARALELGDDDGTDVL